MRVGVVTDSTCDLPAATLKRVRVEAVPLKIVVGEEVYRDWRDIDPSTLYEWIETQGVVPTVKSPEPEDFMQVYRRSFQRFESLVSIHVSPAFSRTLENARAAASRLGILKHVRFVDSGYAGAGLADVVLEAARLARQGAGVDEVEEAANKVRKELYGVLCPSPNAWLGSDRFLGRLDSKRHRLLRRRQLLAMENGKLTGLGWTSSARVGEALAAKLQERFGNRELLLSLAYAGADHEDLGRLRAAIEGAGLVIGHGRLQLIGPAVGARLGPGAATVFARPWAQE